MFAAYGAFQALDAFADVFFDILVHTGPVIELGEYFYNFRKSEMKDFGVGGLY